jgi:RNA polymerase sigma factor (sigma-70 family)
MTPLPELITRAANRDETAWAELVGEFGPMLRSIAAGFRLGPEESADAAQTTWLNFLLHIDRIREPERVGGWLAITMRHECLRLVRQNPRELALEDWMLTGDDDGLVERVARDERDRTLWNAVDRLPAHQRNLVRALARDPEPSYRQVAAAMSIPVGSIGPTRARALGRLGRMLELHGIGRAA